MVCSMVAPKRTARAKTSRPWVGIVMGSKTDWETMSAARDVLEDLKIPFEAKIVSAHRTPDEMLEYAASALDRGLEVIIAGAGGAAHLPGMIAAKTLLPVIGVPVASTALLGLDSLLSIVQMPKGTPVATMAIGKPGAANAAFFAARMLSLHRPDLKELLASYRLAKRDEVLHSKI